MKQKELESDLINFIKNDESAAVEMLVKLLGECKKVKWWHILDEEDILEDVVSLLEYHIDEYMSEKCEEIDCEIASIEKHLADYITYDMLVRHCPKDRPYRTETDLIDWLNDRERREYGCITDVINEEEILNEAGKIWLRDVKMDLLEIA